MSSGDVIVGLVVAAALCFDFTNGFHDTANAMATTIATGALPPRVAVALAAILNFVGAFISLKVAATIAGGIVEAGAITPIVVFGGLVGAICWNLATWWFGLPSSSSQALIGGVVGATLAAAGTSAVNFSGILANVIIPAVASPIVAGLVEKVAIPSLLAPLFGIVTAAALMLALMWIVRRRAPGLVNRVFRRLQLVSGGFVAFTHGQNDAQKTMGIIALALVASGHLAPDFDRPPTWVIVSAALAMGLGTYAGGWRIIKTLGTRIAKLDPPRGFAAQTATAGILWTTAHYGFPVSTTHTISGSVLGAGATRRLNAVRWGVAGNILVAWVLTIPAAGLVGAGMEVITRLPAGDALVFALAAVIAAVAFGARSWQTRRVTHAQDELAAWATPAGS